ncbi:hypothetical protein [Roseateles saccharophilus]|uniref:Secreted protein with PEP-CTERM sorting signal n=1 Tax=Roseateles saccharophilus TaxID=304 RepID=A0A4R3UX45_ROSSA|nr:hypothetical protein [Roseateles saccharophilus]MDG0832692.1 hypothetical protein [Roseateles saccharophilus]TCU95373.1 hypothetical protein EV671_101565 [Roseateles saccharophilus]
MRRTVRGFSGLAAGLMLMAGGARADLVAGTLYFTYFSGGANVNDVAYNYDSSTHSFSLGAVNNLAGTNGADGIIFAPNGNLLVGGQCSGNVYEVNPGNGNVVGSGNTLGGCSYHLALDPSGGKVYTSDFGGELKVMPLPLTNATTVTVNGGDQGVTGLAFTPGGSAYYVNGSPNGHGNVGHIDPTTGATIRLFTGLTPAHGMVFDSYTKLMTLFGDGFDATFNPLAGSDAGIVSSLKQSQQVTCDFDQGAVDGKGHALVAGCNQITFIDYSISGDITHPDYATSIGGFSNIDDVAPLSGLGSNNPPGGSLPEPMSLALAGLALSAALGVTGKARRR